MINVREYRGHIRNWEALCGELGIDKTLSREEREEQILIKAYETWGYDMANHMHGMFAFALWDEEEQKLFCLRDQFGTKPFIIMKQKKAIFSMVQPFVRLWSSRAL